MKRVLFACGGTGGHVFPALAIARELQLRGADVAVAGRAESMESRLCKEHVFFPVRAVPLVRGSLLQNLRLPFAFSRSLLDALGVLKKFRPDVVVGTGGYVSLPVLLAGVWKKIPVYVQEQNAVMGVANRIAARFARLIFTATHDVAGNLPSAKVLNLGNPIRSLPEKETLAVPEVFRGAEDRFKVLVLGGSQGAAGINRKLKKSLKEISEHPKIVWAWQCGSRSYDSISAALPKNLDNLTLFDFINDVYACLQHADLVISRAGASSLAEILAFGKASILVPYPFATANHQEKNARDVEKKGASLVEPDGEPDELWQKVATLENDRKLLEKMTAIAADLGVRDAAECIADLIIKEENWK